VDRELELAVKRNSMNIFAGSHGIFIPADEMAKYDHELAQWIFRTKGDQEYKRYLDSFNPPEPETNLPKLQFFDEPNIHLILESLKQCSYEKSSKDGKKKEDVAEFEGDDPYDMLRMLVGAADSLVAQSAEANDIFLKREVLETKLKQTQDMTSYYRNMRQLEHIDAPKAISRYRSKYSRIRAMR
jgi:methanogenic corrinoid protein MtbC1